MKANEIKVDVVVTRHASLVKYLKEEGILVGDVEVLSHANAEDVRGKRALGVLPRHLSCLCKTFTEVPLYLTPEMRGKELTVEDIRQVAGKPVTYVDLLIQEYVSRINMSNMDGAIGNAPKFF